MDFWDLVLVRSIHRPSKSGPSRLPGFHTRRRSGQRFSAVMGYKGAPLHPPSTLWAPPRHVRMKGQTRTRRCWSDSLCDMAGAGHQPTSRPPPQTSPHPFLTFLFSRFSLALGLHPFLCSPPRLLAHRPTSVSNVWRLEFGGCRRRTLSVRIDDAGQRAAHARCWSPYQGRPNTLSTGPQEPLLVAGMQECEKVAGLDRTTMWLLGRLWVAGRTRLVGDRCTNGDGGAIVRRTVGDLVNKQRAHSRSQRVLDGMNTYSFVFFIVTAVKVSTPVVRGADVTPD